MLKLAANLSTMFGEGPLESRFAMAAECGFKAVEMQFPYALGSARLARLLRENGLELALFNAPAGDIAGGERGLAIEGGQRFAASIETALEYAAATGCTKVHVMIGNGVPGDRATMTRAAASIATAAPQFVAQGVDVLLEALNPHDQPAYAVPSLAHAEELRQMIGQPNVMLQLDAYHAARNGEDPLALLARHASHIGHIQLADPADRGEPDSQLMRSFLMELSALEWVGFVGCEYNPRGETAAGLDWAKPFGLGLPESMMREPKGPVANG